MKDGTSPVVALGNITKWFRDADFTCLVTYKQPRKILSNRVLAQSWMKWANGQSRRYGNDVIETTVPNEIYGNDPLCLFGITSTNDNITTGLDKLVHLAPWPVINVK